jgi:hypothetical protein
MAKGTEIENTDGPDIIGYLPVQVENMKWETSHVEAGDQVVFERIGDTLIGVYAGHDLIYPDSGNADPVKAAKWFIKLSWTIPDGSVFTNAGYELRQAYVSVTLDDNRRPVVTDRIPVGSMTRTVLMKTVDVDQQDPMKSYRVDVAPSNGQASADSTA